MMQAREMEQCKKKKKKQPEDRQTGDEGINNSVFAYMFLEL